ncbi:MAG: peptide chain release factor N(5)-glutamine methyltransferase [Ignavibacteria bacterium]|nr:peptide chain release factor N(5)-glutamine methyltransferase [Ignavibacteria bacterium]
MLKVPDNLSEFINVSVKIFEQNKIKDARLNAELLLCDVLKCSRIDLYLNFDKPLTKDETKIYKDYVKRRLNNEPLQYILGKTSFYGFDIMVNDKVLIPRQETEILVEKVLNDIKSRTLKEVSVFEIGAGSGCISIALTKMLKLENLDVKIYAVDISAEALEVAEKNCELNGLKHGEIKFIVKDIFEIEKLSRNFDYIVSNPPYIPFDEYTMLEKEVKDYEPLISLTDKENGLKFYERIFKIASDETFTGKIYCEIGFDQKEDLEKILLQYNFSSHCFYKDYSGNFRILEVKK